MHFIRINILRYADDIVLLCPSANGLQFLIDKLYYLIDNICLKINIAKSCYMMFKAKRYKNVCNTSKMFFNGIELKLVNEYSYLGSIISSDMKISKDIDRCSKSFLKQFYGVYSRFGYSDKDVMRYLYETHCMSFYGS